MTTSLCRLFCHLNHGIKLSNFSSQILILQVKKSNNKSYHKMMFPVINGDKCHCKACQPLMEVGLYNIKCK